MTSSSSTRTVAITLAVAIACVLVPLATRVLADELSDPLGVPRLVPFRGRLEQAGVPVNRDVSVEISLYDSAVDGLRVWGPDTFSVRVVNGEFTVMLGSGEVPMPSSVVSGGDLYAGFAVDGVALSGRMRLVSTPYALRADTAARALASDDGVPAGAILFFDTPTCPDGWERESAYDGRYLVIAPAGGTIGALAGPPLSDVERRALPDHTHLVSGTTGTVSFFGSDVVNTGGPIYDGRLVMDSAVNDRIVHHVHGVSIASSATSAGVGADVAPYVQLLACRRR